MLLKYEDFEPSDWQEKHSPTTVAEFAANDNVQIRWCRRRVQDERIWRQIGDQHLEREAIRICRAFHFITFGRGIRTSQLVESFERSGLESFLNDQDFLDYLIRCKEDYLKWINLCKKEKIQYYAIIDILYFGLSITEVEKSYRKRHGWAMKNLVQGLKLYI